MSFQQGKIVDVKRYVDWVATNPSVSGYKNYFEAYQDKFGVKEKQVSLNDFKEE